MDLGQSDSGDERRPGPGGDSGYAVTEECHNCGKPTAIEDLDDDLYCPDCEDEE